MKTSYDDLTEADRVASEQANFWKVEFIVWDREGLFYVHPVGTTLGSDARMVSEFSTSGIRRRGWQCRPDTGTVAV